MILPEEIHGSLDDDPLIGPWALDGRTDADVRRQMHHRVERICKHLIQQGCIQDVSRDERISPIGEGFFNEEMRKLL